MSTRIAISLAIFVLNYQYVSSFQSRLQPFVQPRLSSPIRTDSSVSMYLESEWYVEPPPKKMTAPLKLPKGVVVQVRELESKDELFEFLQEDDRLCLVRVHATW